MTRGISAFILLLLTAASTRAAINIPISRHSLFSSSASSSPSPSASDFKSLRDGLLAKYTSPESSKKSKRATSTVPTTNFLGDVTYTAQIKLGSEGQAFDVILDTGSSDTWVASDACRRCTAGPVFSPSSSSSFVPASLALSISYGSGDISGRTGIDKVQLGGFTVQNQTIGVVDVADTFLPSTASGLMGLAFSRLAKSGGVPWWLNVFAGSPAPDSNLFSFWFSRYLETTLTQAPGGQFTIGGTNSSLYTGNITYTPISSAIWWTIPLQQVLVNGAAVNIPSTLQGAIVDTGTTLIGGPEVVLDAIFSRINGTVKGAAVHSDLVGYYVIPCSIQPSLSLTFSGVSFPMQPIDIFFQTLGSIAPGYCVSSLFVYGKTGDPVLSGQPQWIIGDAFLKNVYSVFSLGTGDASGSGAAVGFAKLSDVNGEIGLSGDFTTFPLTAIQTANITGTLGTRFPTELISPVQTATQSPSSSSGSVFRVGWSLVAFVVTGLFIWT